MSFASEASESSIDWFWQTRQRNSDESARARASSAGSRMISSGCTAMAAGAAKTSASEKASLVRQPTTAEAAR